MSCQRLSWPVSGKPIVTRPIAHLRATCPVHGETVAHTGLHPAPSTAEGFVAPVYAGCCGLRLGYAPQETAPVSPVPGIR